MATFEYGGFKEKWNIVANNLFSKWMWWKKRLTVHSNCKIKITASPHSTRGDSRPVHLWRAAVPQMWHWKPATVTLSTLTHLRMLSHLQYFVSSLIASFIHSVIWITPNVWTMMDGTSNHELQPTQMTGIQPAVKDHKGSVSQHNRICASFITSST